MRDILNTIEQRVDNTTDVFELLDYLKTLAVLQHNSEAMNLYEIMIIGLIERIQERIVLKWYE